MPEIRYTFTASGQEAVQQAFKGIDRTAQSTGKAQQAAAKAASRAQQQEQRAVQKAQAQALRQQQQQQRAMQREQQRAFRERIRLEKTAERQRAKELQATQKAQQARREELSKLALGITASIGAVIAGAVAGVGAFVTSAWKKTEEERNKARRLAVKTSTGTDRRDPEAFRKRAFEASRGVAGVSTSDVLAGVAAGEGRAGNIDLLLEASPFMARLAGASGASMEDVGAIAGEAIHSMGITSAYELEDALSALYVTGKRTQTELNSMAGIFAELGPMAKKAGMEGREGVEQISGLFQMARTRTGSDAGAQGALTALFKGITGTKGAALEKLGVQVFEDEGKTKLANVNDILMQTIQKTNGNMQQLSIALGDKATPLIEALAEEYRKAVDAEPGTQAQKAAAGTEAMKRALDALKSSTDARKEVDMDLATVTRSTIAQLSTFEEELTSAVGSGFAEGLDAAGFSAQDFAELVTNAGIAAKILGEMAGGAAQGVSLFMKFLKDPKGEHDAMGVAQDSEYKLAEERGKRAGKEIDRITKKLEKFKGRTEESLSKEEKLEKRLLDRQLKRAKDQEQEATDDLAAFKPTLELQKGLHGETRDVLARHGVNEKTAGRIADLAVDNPDQAAFVLGLQRFLGENRTLLNMIPGGGVATGLNDLLFGPEAASVDWRAAMGDVGQAARGHTYEEDFSGLTPKINTDPADEALKNTAGKLGEFADAVGGGIKKLTELASTKFSPLDTGHR